MTWQSIDGRWRIYADGELRDSGAGFAVGSAVEPNGTIILGQEQDSRGGDFSNAESMIGALYGVELWSRVLDADELAAMITSCTVTHHFLIIFSVKKALSPCPLISPKE